MKDPLSNADYQTLAAFRHALKRFLHFSENAARSAGLTPQQHQALLAIRAGGQAVSVGGLAAQLLIQPHSASELVDRLAALGFIGRQKNPEDRRGITLSLTHHAEALLASLSVAHRDELRQLRPLLGELLAKID